MPFNEYHTNTSSEALKIGKTDDLYEGRRDLARDWRDSQRDGSKIIAPANKVAEVFSMYINTKGFKIIHKDHKLFLIDPTSLTSVLIFDSIDSVLATPQNSHTLFYNLSTNQVNSNLIKENMQTYAKRFGEKLPGKDHPKWVEYLLKVLVESTDNFLSSANKLPQSK